MKRPVKILRRQAKNISLLGKASSFKNPEFSLQPVRFIASFDEATHLPHAVSFSVPSTMSEVAKSLFESILTPVS